MQAFEQHEKALSALSAMAGHFRVPSHVKTESCSTGNMAARELETVRISGEYSKNGAEEKEPLRDRKARSGERPGRECNSRVVMTPRARAGIEWATSETQQEPIRFLAQGFSFKK
ncbi:MAG: hypothetical protein DMG32_23960 [Acidobacteria bacterium]|nr:MAG: hypothetical protein DMG32_23960 [Acidobacteriota bacterium]